MDSDGVQIGQNPVFGKEVIQDNMKERLNWLELGLGAVGMAGLGSIVGATLNSSSLISCEVSSWFPPVVFASLYLLGRLWFEKSRENIHRRKTYYLAMMMVAALALISIPFLFWEVFLKLIDSAGKGGTVL